MLGRDLVKRLPEVIKNLDGKINLHAEAQEHFIFYNDAQIGTQSVILYPTLYSINERLKLAKSLGCGVSVWEIGQGLDYFYDLF